MKQKELLKRFLPIVFIFFVVTIFFWPFFSKLLLPIPTDNIVGMFHPFTDFYRSTFTRGVPFKNYMIEDPIKQQYPWRELVISLEKKLQLPLWNPYTFAGAPLLANFQSASFYPFNLLFFILPFSLSWSLIIVLEPLLAAVFLYAFLKNLKLSNWASVMGSISFAFCGFFTSWLEWGTVVHSALWLPLVLLCIDKIFDYRKFKKLVSWTLLFIFSLISSFSAGHLQVFFYVFVVSFSYFLFRFFERKASKKFLFPFVACLSLIVLIISIQLVPTIQFIQLSARSIDQANWKQNPGWFVPWQHVVQFVAPDFFGNPATRNYSSIFNYGEFVGYIGILPMLMSFVALFFRRDKETTFFIVILFASFLFAFPTFISQIPFVLQIPFVSTSQPTRLLFVIDFALSVLSALGLDYFLANREKIHMPTLLFTFILFLLWILVLGEKFLHIQAFNAIIAQRNLYFPSLVFTAISVITFWLSFDNSKKRERILLVLLLIITTFDLIRFASKYNVFQSQDFLFPQTKTIAFLKQQKGLFRIMTTDEPVFPPNFSVIFRLQSLDGYDPLYLKRYAQFIAASERNRADISEPFGFNKIVSPHTIDSKLADLLGVRYILSRIDLKSKKIKKVFQEGKTRIYENANAFPRAFFVTATRCFFDKQDVIEKMFISDLHATAFIEDKDLCSKLNRNWSEGEVVVTSYSENRITLETENEKDGFLVFLDSYYPTWHAKIQNEETKIYLTDFNFRGIVIPKGKHTIQFYISLL